MFKYIMYIKEHHFLLNYIKYFRNSLFMKSKMIKLFYFLPLDIPISVSNNFRKKVGHNKRTSTMKVS